MANHHKKSAFQIYAEYLPFKVLYTIGRCIPLRMGYPFARFLGRMLFRVDFVHRPRSIQHILHASVAPDAASARKLAMRAFEEFAMLVLEIFKADQALDLANIHVTGDRESVRRFFAPDGPHENFILITGHYGNWEMAGGVIGTLSGHTLVSLMRPFGNPKIGELILRNRRTGTHELVDKAGGIRTILRAIRAHKNIAILIDQHASGNEGAETLFFGQPARTHTSPALLHLKTHVPILPEMTRRLRGDKFEFEIELGPAIEYAPTGDNAHDVQFLTQRCTDELAALIRKAPEQWLWAHRRWLNINRHHHVPQEAVPEKQ